eukprot:TRINITY_DN3106_c0_g1_i1.p1 TRINITY_DN3106_c0_g1~~TRINITY_DN3106_c0_g1_i1.p1  ORF type:complete len:745 (+),score=134.65 TRINITY_DN3106_c0_g1_i1:68-2302(+)
MADIVELERENERLRHDMQEMSARVKQEKNEIDMRVSKQKEQEDEMSKLVKQKEDEVMAMRTHLVRLTRQLDDEVSKRDQIEAESQSLERRLQDVQSGVCVPAATPTRSKGISFEGQKKAEESKKDDGAVRAQVSTKLMRVVDQWMHTKDLQQALLRNTSINDESFSTLVQVLSECKSLAMLDLSHNQLTMDSCSDICRLITSAQSLSFISVAENLFSLRSIGYFMTAVMERQNKKKLTSLEVLDLQGNEGLVAALNAPPPENLLKQIKGSLLNKMPPKGPELIAQVMRALWRFLHYTEHPQVVGTTVDEIKFGAMDKTTIRKMENALIKILLMSAEGEGNEGSPGANKTVHANYALTALLDRDEELADPAKGEDGGPLNTGGSNGERKGGEAGVRLPAIDQQQDNATRGGKAGGTMGGSVGRMEATQRPAHVDLRDPFSDLKTAFEPPKEKLKTFNLKQVVTSSNRMLMTMLERLLETTEIDARDVETDMTLLEYACQQGNLGLAKLCYRRRANLSALTKKGDSYFNIVTKNRRYDLMEFLHTYGVKVNHQDIEGRTALHVAAETNDVDAVCRLLEWGADVNLHDHKKRTPLHIAARYGNKDVTMLLLEVGADMNAKDENEYTAVAHAEAENNFALMDRLVELGGKGHGLSQKGATVTTSKSEKKLGELNVTAGMLKSSSLGRIGRSVCFDCQKTTSAPGLKEHTKSCPQTHAPCPGCKKFFLKRSLKNHQTVCIELGMTLVK